MMDVSDGLASDLQRLSESSRVGFDISSRQVPANGSLRAALTDGEDFELLFTVSHRNAKRLQALWKFPVSLTQIGRVIPRRVVLVDGQLLTEKGYDHFTQHS